jgi:thiamine biosynthesis lipoprotein
MTAVYEGQAWSCTVRLAVDDAHVLAEATRDFTALLARVDAVASRFRADSALSVANARAGRPTPIPRLLVDLVDAALGAAAQTDGLVDPTIGLAMQRIGYDRDITRIDPDGPPISPVRRLDGRSQRGWQRVGLDREIGLLTVPVGTALDLGATAKAYVADHAALALSRRYDTAVMIELGGDLSVAGLRPDGWCIQVAEQAGGAGQLVLVRHGGLATSTTTVRRWRRGGQQLHHVIDPRTAAPAAGPWRTVSVAAPCALAANVASTAAIVLGDAALGWLEARGLAARLVGLDGSIATTADWPVAALAVAS